MSTINVRSYKGQVRPDGTPIELPQKVLKLTKKANMRHNKPNRSRVGDFLVGLLPFLVAHFVIDATAFVGYPWAAATWPALFGLPG